MTDRSGVFAGDEPFAIARAWLDEAAATEPNDPGAAALATVDGDGLPNVRMVLLKEIAADGFVFYTNYTSAKGRELDGNPKAAMVLHWKSLRRQIRVRGPVDRVGGARADSYYASRAPGSRIGAWASRQSQVLAARSDLEARVEEIRARFGEDPPRPPFWGGYRIEPVEIEFWADGANRLHDRFRWRRDDAGARWYVERLSP
jgi:pyridoxamine 5'-phosphate oxidase